MGVNDLDKLEASNGNFQDAELSTLMQSQLWFIRKAVTADATGALSITVPFAMDIVDVVVQCTGASGSGTLTVRSGTNAITDAMICAVDTTIVRAGTIDDAYSSITTATSLNVIANGANDRGVVTIIGRRV